MRNQFFQRLEVEIAMITLQLFDPVVIQLFEKIAAIQLDGFGQQLRRAFIVVIAPRLAGVAQQALELFRINAILILRIEQVSAFAVEHEIFFDHLPGVQRFAQMRNRRMKILGDGFGIGVAPEGFDDLLFRRAMIAPRGDVTKDVQRFDQPPGFFQRLRRVAVDLDRAEHAYRQINIRSFDEQLNRRSVAQAVS